MQIRFYSRRVVASVLMLMATGTVWAQPPGSAGRSPGAQVTERFKSAPDVGQSLPDVTLYAADGRQLSLADLKGNFSVIVFGCLT